MTYTYAQKTAERDNLRAQKEQNYFWQQFSLLFKNKCKFSKCFCVSETAQYSERIWNVLKSYSLRARVAVDFKITF